MWLNSMISVLILKSSIATSKVVLLLLGELFVLGLLHNLQGPGNHLALPYLNHAYSITIALQNPASSCLESCVLQAFLFS